MKFKVSKTFKIICGGLIVRERECRENGRKRVRIEVRGRRRQEQREMGREKERKEQRGDCG